MISLDEKNTHFTWDRCWQVDKASRKSLGILPVAYTGTLEGKACEENHHHAR